MHAMRGRTEVGEAELKRRRWEEPGQDCPGERFPEAALCEMVLKVA